MFSICFVLAIKETIHFGNGLGDLFYLFGLGICSIATIVMSILITTKNAGSSVLRHYDVISIISFFVLLYFIYSCTIGRGSENPWNGQIFYQL